MSKIKEIIVEPTKVTCGSIFKIKIKVDRFLTYEEIENLTVDKLNEFRVEQLEGEN